MSERHAVFILGSHRSGTSCLGGALKAMGLFMGMEHFLGEPQGDNAKGFFEYQPLVHINNEILRRLGGEWCKTPTFPPGWQWSHMFADLRAMATQTVSDGFRGHDIWGFKDPRSSLTLPFWRAVLALPIRCTILVRNPLEVAHSLLKRNCMPLDQGANLWLSHLRWSFEGSRGLPRRLVFFDTLVEDPRGELAGIADFVGLKCSEQALGNGAAWVERGLKHQNQSPHETASSPIPERVKKAWVDIQLFGHLTIPKASDENSILSVLSRS